MLLFQWSRRFRAEINSGIFSYIFIANWRCSVIINIFVYLLLIILQHRPMSEQYSQLFFNTEINPGRLSHSPNNEQASLGNKLGKLKQKVKQIDQVYKRSLSEKIKVEKTVAELNLSAQKARLSFMKLYDKKKAKMLNKTRVKAYSLQSQSRREALSERVKQQRLKDEYYLEQSQRQKQQSNTHLRQQNLKSKEHTRKEIKIKNIEALSYAKTQYNRIKQQKQNVIERNKKIGELLAIRSQVNYIEKVQRQLSAINYYQQLLGNVTRTDGSLGQQLVLRINYQPKEQQGFFMTDKPFSRRTSRQETKTPLTSR